MQENCSRFWLNFSYPTFINKKQNNSCDAKYVIVEFVIFYD